MARRCQLRSPGGAAENSQGRQPLETEDEERAESRRGGTLAPRDACAAPSGLRLPVSLAIGTLTLLLTLTSPAAAHQIHLFAHADGSQIQGEVYVRGGQPVREARVRAFSPTGEALGETTSDAQGSFTLAAPYRCDYRLVAGSGDGHEAQYTLAAEELPESLPPYTASDAAPAKLPSSSATVPAKVEAAKVESAESGLAAERLESLHGQVVQLRKQLDAYEQKVRWHDILGGIGYILGLMGVASYFLAARRRGSDAVR